MMYDGHASHNTGYENTEFDARVPTFCTTYPTL
jgi:hypothetical protein